MPIFDQSSSQAARNDAGRLRAGLGPRKAHSSPFRRLASDYRRRERRARVTRAGVVVGLTSLLGGSAMLASRESATEIATDRVVPADLDGAASVTGSIRKSQARGSNP
jgi:hypothetical protein